MKRKLIFASLLILVLVTLSCVSAADDIQTTDLEAIDDVQAEDISIYEDSSSEEILTDGESDVGTFSDFYNDLENDAENNQMELKRNYTYNENTDSGDLYFSNLVDIDNFVLDGKGHTLNGGNKKSLFNFNEGKNIILKNICFVDFYTPIYVNSYPVTIYNCSFIDCSQYYTTYDGGAIHDVASSRIDHCTFIDNSADNKGGAIYSSSNTTIIGCEFYNNNIESPSFYYKVGGGAIYLNGESPLVKDCFFKGNTIPSPESVPSTCGGGAIYATENVTNGKIVNSNFTGNNAPFGGAIYSNQNLTIDGCQFLGSNGASKEGGAVYFNLYGYVNNSSFYGNSAGNEGGAICAYRLFLTNSTFGGNNVMGEDSKGDALSVWGSCEISDCKFNGNGGTNGISLYVNCDLTIKNTFFSYLENIYHSDYYELILSNVDTCNEIIENNASYNINSGGTYKATVKDKDGNALAGENVTFVVGDKVIASGITDGNGTVAIKLTANILKGLKAGTHDLHIQLARLYQDKIVKLTVKKDPAAITAKAASFVINYAGKYSVTIRNSAGKVLSGQKVTFTLKGKYIGSATTNAKGVATISLSAKVLKAAKYGTKNLVIKLDSPLYTSASKTVKVTIKKEKTSIVAAKKSFKKSLKVKKYTITLKNSKGKIIKNAKLTLKVKGKTFKATTNSKGKATFKITNLKKKGKFTASIKFKTTPYYLKSSKSVKLTIK